jgi:hypothetical protein
MADFKDSLPSYHQIEGNNNNTTPLTSTSTGNFQASFASLSLHKSDTIRLINFPAESNSQITELIRRHWPRGIQDIGTYGHPRCTDVKLLGTPWNPPNPLLSGGDKAASRRLMCGLLGGMFDMGWILIAAADVTKKNERDKDSLLFRYQQPSSPPPPSCQWMSISFAHGDLLYVIDGPEELGPALAKALGTTVQRHAPFEKSSNNNSDNDNKIYEIKFREYPWRPTGTETVVTRIILLGILKCLEQYGFGLYASIDQDSGASDVSSVADTWHCNRRLDWIVGSPVYRNL